MTSKQEFLEAKAQNFKKYLLSFEPNEQAKEIMEKFDTKNIIPIILTQLLPLVSAGLHTSTVSEIVTGLKIPDGKEDEVKSKIVKYFEMFCEVVSA